MAALVGGADLGATSLGDDLIVLTCRLNIRVAGVAAVPLPVLRGSGVDATQDGVVAVGQAPETVGLVQVLGRRPSGVVPADVPRPCVSVSLVVLDDADARVRGRRRRAVVPGVGEAVGLLSARNVVKVARRGLDAVQAAIVPGNAPTELIVRPPHGVGTGFGLPSRVAFTSHGSVPAKVDATIGAEADGVGSRAEQVFEQPHGIQRYSLRRITPVHGENGEYSRA